MIRVRPVVETVALAVAGGAILAFAGLPAGWLSGALVAVALGVAAGRDLTIPKPVAGIVFVALGISMGGAVTPDTLRSMATWPLSIAALLAAMVAVTVATSVWLRLVHGWTRRDALLASVPGALSQVMIVALSTHADSRAIAVVQTFRVMVLTAFLPGALALAGLAATGVAPVPVTANPLERPGELALLVGASTLAGLAAQRLRFPGGLMLGALIASALLHGSGVVTVGPPAPVLVVCFVLLGALMGLRFAGTDAALLRRLMAAACGALVVSVAVAGLAALVVSAALSLPVAGTVVAFAPGALEAMTILAFAMGLDVAFVGAHHVVRFLVISLALPVLVRFGQANSATPRKTLDQ